MSTPLKELLQDLKAWVEAYPQVWIKAYPEMESFLKDSYLVVVCTTKEGHQHRFVQFEVRDFLQSYRQGIWKYPSILKDTDHKGSYLRRLRRKAGNARLEPLEKLLEVEAYTIEPRFTSMNMDFIQRLKEDALVNQEMTSMSRASINIRLREGPFGLDDSLLALVTLPNYCVARRPDSTSLSSK